MKYGCPNKYCKYHKKKDFVVKDGTYFRKNDSRSIKRFKCNHCKKKFSSATFSLARNQKKRRINFRLFTFLASGISMRRAAFLLHIHPITVARKLIYLSKVAELSQQKRLEELRSCVEHMQFDDMIGIEHTKLKPLTISLGIDVTSRIILGAEVGRIPAFGHLARPSRKKYGFRKCEHKETLIRLFEKIKDTIKPNCSIQSDEHPLYPSIVKKYCPNSPYIRHKGGRGCVVGQGELKKLHYDPLFKLNHSCAMFRANINRLFRKTWCTTKKPESLQHHINIYIDFFNGYLLQA